jgi:hypothetical protein
MFIDAMAKVSALLREGNVSLKPIVGKNIALLTDGGRRGPVSSSQREIWAKLKLTTPELSQNRASGSSFC